MVISKGLIGSFIITVLALLIFGPRLVITAEFALAQYTDAVYAVRLDSGQVVFGNLRSAGRWVKLTNVHSFQPVEVNGQTTNNLVSQASNTLTEPLNFMLVNRDRVVAIERVGPDAQILRIMSQ